MGPVRLRIESFLRAKRIAFVGVSRRPEHFSRTVLEELVQRGYDVVAVNPHVEPGSQIAGRPTFGAVQQIDRPVEWALIMTPSAQMTEAVTACHQAGIRHLWLHHGGGSDRVPAEALAYAERTGLEVVPGECPLMFLKPTGAIHRIHGFCKRVVGTYPS